MSEELEKCSYRIDGQYFLMTTLTSVLPPTTFLLPLARPPAHSIEDVALTVQQLWDIYRSPNISFLAPPLGLPKKKMQPFIFDSSFPDSGYASAEEEEEAKDDITSDNENLNADLEILRADPFEHAGPPLCYL